MANTKVLLVSSNGDYGATVYEDFMKTGELLPEHLWEKSWTEQKSFTYELHDDMLDEDTSFDYTAYRFGDIDPEFIEFINANFPEYREHTNFYII